MAWHLRLRFCFFLLLLLLLAPAGVVRADDDAADLDPTGKFLDVLATNGLPSLYGEVLGYLQEQGAVEFTKVATLYTQGGKLGVTGQMLTTAAAQKEIRDRIAFWNQTLGRAAAGVDITGKLATGEYKEAAISGGMTLISELAGTESGKAVLQSLGISPPFVSATLLTYTIWRESSKAAADAEAGRMLESLYGSIENMARSRGRTLGQGDPFPATQENVEKVWRRILNDSDFRERFKVYVTQELQQEFPEAGYFDWAASHVGGAAVDEVTRQRLQEQEKWVRQYVIGLINWLNRAAKAREQEVLLRQHLAEAALKIKMNGGSLEKAMARFDAAVSQLGVVNAYINSAPRDIQAAIEKDDYETLLAHLKMIPDYVRNVVAWLPVKGPLSDVREQYMAALKERYRMAAEGIKGIRLKLKKRIETPQIAPPAQPATQGVSETPPAAESAPAADAAADAARMYQQYLAPVIRPFDWGGGGDPERVKPTYERYLAGGKFSHAALVEQAWRQQNFSLAIGGVEGIQTLPAPAESETFEGYRRRVLNAIAAVPEPGEIVSLRQSLQAQGEAIDKLWLDGNCLVFPGSFRCEDRPRPPAGETREEVMARQERGQAIMAQAREMSEALTPSRQRLAQLQESWSEAGNLARKVIDDNVLMARVRQDELLAWMNAVRQTHEDRARLARDGLERFRTTVGALLLPPEGAVPAEEQLAELEALASEQSYTGFGTFSNPQDDRMLDALERELSSRASRLLNDAATYYRQGETLQGAVLSAADGYRNVAETFPSLFQEVAPLVDDIVLFVEPRFREELSTLSARAERAKSLAGRLADRGARAGAAIATDRENREADAYHLRQLGRNLRSFREWATTLGVMAESGRKPSLPSGREYDTLRLSHPYPHYLTANERDRIVAELRNMWNEGKLSSFSSTAAPWLNEAVDRYLQELSRIPTFPEDNFCISSDGGVTAMPVTVSGLARAKVLHASMAPGEESFEAGFREIRTVLPLEIRFHGGSTGTFATLIKGGWESTPLGKEYLAFRNQLKEQYALHLVRREEVQKREQQRLARELMGNMSAWLGELRQRIAQGEQLIGRSESLTAGDRPALEAALRELSQFHDHLTDDPYRQAMEGTTVIFSVIGPDEPAGREAVQVGQSIGQLSGRLHQARERLTGLISRGPQFDLTVFYETFRTAYESRDESAVMALVGDDWEAGDGTTLADLQGHLRNSFTVFDQIEYRISNLSSSWNGNAYTVSYDVTITGRNFRHNLRHEEKSTVNEEVMIDDRGKPRITRTLSGRFWYVR